MAVCPLSEVEPARQSLLNTDRPKLRLVHPESPPGLSDQLSNFRIYLIADLGLSASTIRNHVRVIAKVLRDIDTLHPDHNQIKGRLVWLLEQEYSYAHIANVSLAMENYMAFLGDPIKLARPRKPKPLLKDTLTEAEVSVIIACAHNIREKAALAVLAYSGIRNDELCHLRVSDVDVGANTIRVAAGKGQKGRLVNVPGECSKIVLAYLDAYPRPSDSYLFTTLREGRRFRGHTLRRMVKKVAARSNVKKAVYPHLFRHSLAVNMLQRGAHLLTIKDQLGHEFIETTMLYLRVINKRAKAEYQLYCPSYL